MICDTCGEKHCKARESIHVKRAFPIPNYIEGNDKYRYIRILQQKAEHTGKCSKFCGEIMGSSAFRKHRRSINADGH